MKKKPNDAQEDGQLQECLHNGEVASDGWAIIPYGDWPHEMGMQKFHRPQAEAIVAAFENAAGRFFRRAVVGLPILKGHPDHPVAAIANQYPDKGDKGQIAEMEARDDGLALRLILSSAGADLVRKGWKFISPLWLGQLVRPGPASRPMRRQRLSASASSPSRTSPSPLSPIPRPPRQPKQALNP